MTGCPPTACNSAYKRDEEYYVVCFAGHADSETGRAVFDDWRRGLRQGHDPGLWKAVVNQFGKVVTADGSVVFNFDVDRTGRVSWKLIRGIYYRETGRLLAENAPKRLFMLGREEARRAHENYPWWALVRDTKPMGEHGMVSTASG